MTHYVGIHKGHIYLHKFELRTSNYDVNHFVKIIFRVYKIICFSYRHNL